MKKLFFLFFLVLTTGSFYLFATEEYESFQPYYKSYYKGYGTGKSVVVAVIDEGVWQSHPDLKGSEWTNKKDILDNGKDDDKNGYVDDYFGWNFIDNNSDVTPKGNHGTAVAGIIGAQINGKGIAGIVPDAKIMSLIACNDDGCPTKSVIDAILYAVNNGAQVINLSLGSQGYVAYDSRYDEALKYAYTKGVVVVVAAGNGDPESSGRLGQDLDLLKVSPVCNDVDGVNIVLGVGATYSGGNQPTRWSNFGKCVDVWAQGEKIISTVVPKFDNDFFYDSTLAGTSFAAPIISGIVAILRSAYPKLTPLELIDIMSSVNPYDLNELTKMVDTNPCRINRFDLSIKNGESITIEGLHLRPFYSFSLISTDSDGKQTKTSTDKGIRVIDANRMSLDTGSINLQAGTYAFKETNDKCVVDWNALTILGKTPSSTPTTNIPVTTNGVIGLNTTSSGSDADFLSDKFIIKKQSDLLDYRLDAKVLRQEVIAMAVKIAGINLPANYTCKRKFNDISALKPNNWVCRSVELASNNQIISSANSKFRPEDNITRSEALSILMKAAHIEIQEFQGVSKFSDVNLAWQVNVTNTALLKGFIDGTEKFYPNNQALRSDIFNMARRIMEKTN